MSDDYWQDQREADAQFAEEQMVVAIVKIEQVPQKWYFTFGYSHVDQITGVRLRNKYCVVEGLHDEARDVILQRFGQNWCMQYPHADNVPEPERELGVPHFQYRGAGVQAYNLELFNHVLAEAVIAEAVDENGKSISDPTAYLVDYYDSDEIHE